MAKSVKSERAIRMMATKRLNQVPRDERRKTPYYYREGTHLLSCSPRKLSSDWEMNLAATLAIHVPMRVVASLLGVSVPTASRAVRMWNHSNAIGN